MIKVYLPLEIKGEDGKFYKEFEIQEGLPLGEEIVYIEPPENLIYPRWDRERGVWVEDKDSIIEDVKGKDGEVIGLKKEIEELHKTHESLTQQLELIDDTILELMVDILPNI